MKTAPPIRVHNRQRKITVDLAGLQTFGERALRQAIKLKPRRGSVLGEVGQLDVVLVSDARMARLHRRFMKLSGPTDVITFQHGEMFVSTETAANNATRYQTTPEREIRLYLVHGILHLMGFDDTTTAAARQMAEAQRRVVASAAGAA